MSIRKLFIKSFAKSTARKLQTIRKNAVADQDKIRTKLVKRASKTEFGKDHHFKTIADYDDFKNAIPIRDYEGLSNYVDRITKGEKNILWPGKPKYFAKTSGTTSGVKYIPITHSSIKSHIIAARDALFNYVHLHQRPELFERKLIFLSGSPSLSAKAGIKLGRLSGIVNHEIPNWLQKNQLPAWETNCIEDWEAKVESIAKETMSEDLSLISGIPPWVQMYFELLLKKTGKLDVQSIFPNFELFVYGGVNYEPYRNTMEKLIGKKIKSLETYPASEGFIAFQDSWKEQGLLLNTNAGMFFEFVPLNEVHDEDPTRYKLGEIELNTDYAILISSNAGLWAYNLGDTVRFVSKDPYRLIVSGRIKHFISAFGEHVIAKEVEESMLYAASKFNCNIVDFTVAPQVNPKNNEIPYHEWFVEFEDLPKDIDAFAECLDDQIIQQNIYYKDLIDGKILQRAKLRCLSKSAFRSYMKSQGKLGGQNKVPRLSNDRKIADFLENYMV